MRWDVATIGIDWEPTAKCQRDILNRRFLDGTSVPDVPGAGSFGVPLTVVPGNVIASVLGQIGTIGDDSLKSFLPRRWWGVLMPMVGTVSCLSRRVWNGRARAGNRCVASPDGPVAPPEVPPAPVISS